MQSLLGKNKIAHFIGTSLLFAVLLICVILAVEVVARISGYCPLSGIIYDPLCGWRLKPQQKYHVYSPGNKQPSYVCTNKSGFRDIDHSLIKSPQTYRIMFLGDSYTAATDVAENGNFVSLLEKILNVHNRSFIRYELMNVAVPAWATDQQLLYLLQEGLRYQPDELILMVSPNDMREAFTKRFIILDQQNKLVWRREATCLPWKERFLWSLANHSATFQYMQKCCKSFYGNFQHIFQLFPIDFRVPGARGWDDALFLKERPEPIPDAERLFKALIHQIAETCRVRRIRLLIVMVPIKMQFDVSLNGEQYDPAIMSRVVGQIAQEEEVRFLDLFVRLQQTPNPLSVFWQHEYHFNERGHQFIANELYDVLKKNTFAYRNQIIINE